MSEEKTAAPIVPRKRPFRTYSYRGIELSDLLKLKQDELKPLFTSRIRRKLNRGLKYKQCYLLKKLRKAKANINPAVGERPRIIKTHLRNAVVLPEMVGSIIGVYSGKEFTTVEIKPDMIGHYLGEFSITYHPVRHGRPGIGATHSSRFIPLR